jgi:hypothetical protein
MNQKMHLREKKITISSTCFEPKSSSSGRRLYEHIWYNLFTCQRYKQSCRWKSVLFYVILKRVHFLVYIIRLELYVSIKGSKMAFPSCCEPTAADPYCREKVNYKFSVTNGYCKFIRELIS